MGETMIEFFHECFNYVNLPVTTLLIMVLLYWLLVALGVFGLDAMDFDLDVDADVGLDADIGIDADVGVDADLGVDVHGGVNAAPGTTISGSSTTANDGILKQVFEFFYLSEVPIVIIGSFFVLYFWMATVITNNWYNADQKFWIAMAWLVPNIIICLMLTRISMIPFAIIFKKSPSENKTREEMHGLIGRVTTSEVTEKFGQMEIKPPNEPEMILNVRTRPGEKLGKGDTAKIVSFNNNDGTFLVELTKWEKNVDG